MTMMAMMLMMMLMTLVFRWPLTTLSPAFKWEVGCNEAFLPTPDREGKDPLRSQSWQPEARLRHLCRPGFLRQRHTRSFLAEIRIEKYLNQRHRHNTEFLERKTKRGKNQNEKQRQRQGNTKMKNKDKDNEAPVWKKNKDKEAPKRKNRCKDKEAPVSTMPCMLSRWTGSLSARASRSASSSSTSTSTPSTTEDW